MAGRDRRRSGAVNVQSSGLIAIAIEMHALIS
jgi:hypothetical protein